MSNVQKPLKVKVSISLDGDVVDRVRELAEADDRNFSQYINRLLRQHVQSAGNTGASSAIDQTQ